MQVHLPTDVIQSHHKMMYPSYGFTNPAHYPPTQEKLGKKQMILFQFLLGTLAGTQWRSLVSKIPDLLLPYLYCFDNFANYGYHN